MLNTAPLNSLDLHFLVTKCNCQTYDVKIGPKLKNLSFVILGAYNMFDKLALLLYTRGLTEIFNFQPFSNFRAFLNTLNAPLSDLSWKTKELRGGALSIRPSSLIFQVSFDWPKKL